MEKNITVIDENGITAGSTYPKRASGLVKKGRAHWIDENTICLCARDMEDNKMSDKIYDVIDNQFSKLQEKLFDMNDPDKVSMSMMDALKEMQTKNRAFDIAEKQLNALNEIMSREAPASDEKTAYAREITKQKILDVICEMLGKKNDIEYSIDMETVTDNDDKETVSASESLSKTE